MSDVVDEQKEQKQRLEGFVLNQRVQICEQANLSHLILRGDHQDKNFILGVEAAVGMPLPQQAYTSQVSVALGGLERCLRWLSADEWLMTVPNDEVFGVEQQLRSELKGDYALVNVTRGQIALILKGEQAEAVLKERSGYQIYAYDFPIGKVVTTGFAHSQVIVRRLAHTEFELIVRRSFANYIHLCLEDTCLKV